jgi:CrcB protein
VGLGGEHVPERRDGERLPGGDRWPIDPDLAGDDPGEPSARHHPIPPVPRAKEHRVLALIGAGGFIGALGRYELGLAWKTPAGHLPWATLVINTSGAFLLGLILPVLLERARPANHLRAFLCIGVLGAWTTMSTFAVESDVLVKDGHPGVAATYVVATVIPGLAVAWAGMLAGRVIARNGRMRWAWR